jgi:glutamine---fructose-6-phosphate transaminase (isomerizing)
LEKQPPRWISGIEPPQNLLSATGTEILEMECREQPQRLHELLLAYRQDSSIRAGLERTRHAIRGNGPVLWIGMGASFCSAISGSVCLRLYGKPSFVADAGEWLHYARAVWGDAALSVLLTTSGESAELVELFRNHNRAPLSLICNNPVSTCWALAESPLPILAGPEYGNATKTYTNAAAASVILACEIIGRPWMEEADRVDDVFARTIDSIFAMRGELEVFCRGAATIEIIGRGAAHGSAIVSALCIREMTGHRAAPHTGAGFRHGPILDVDSSHLAIIYALGRTAELGVKLAAECNRRGGKVILVSSEEVAPAERLLAVQIEAVPEPWEGVTSVLVAQALTLAIVERDGCRLPPRFQYGTVEE